jgi:hypothetical protein
LTAILCSLQRAWLTNTFKRAFKKKPLRLQAAILECVKWLGEDVTNPGLRVHKMQGVGDIWEAYVDQANRVTYEWEGDTIVMALLLFPWVR